MLHLGVSSLSATREGCALLGLGTVMILAMMFVNNMIDRMIDNVDCEG